MCLKGLIHEEQLVDPAGGGAGKPARHGPTSPPQVDAVETSPMRMYRPIWSAVMTVLGVVGLAAALMFLPGRVSALIVICGSAFDAVMRLSVADLAGLEVR